jgi:hypothetical protein
MVRSRQMSSSDRRGFCRTRELEMFRVRFTIDLGAVGHVLRAEVPTPVLVVYGDQSWGRATVVLSNLAREQCVKFGRVGVDQVARVERLGVVGSLAEGDVRVRTPGNFEGFRLLGGSDVLGVGEVVEQRGVGLVVRVAPAQGV